MKYKENSKHFERVQNQQPQGLSVATEEDNLEPLVVSMKLFAFGHIEGIAIG